MVRMRQGKWGSPPPMRGKANSAHTRRCPSRITPAYAGKRSQQDPHGSGLQDHPRLCGEKVSNGFTQKLPYGSPPPMRGKACGTVKYLYATGITPAYAGKSKREPYSFRFSWDHPRLCGEKYTFPHSSIVYKGSPPPMRGKASTVPRRQSETGITPAYAGKSLKRAKLRDID